MFWFKKKKVVVDCFTSMSNLAELTPIRKAIDFLPQWWRDLPAKERSPTYGEFPAPNMKRCPGFVDLYKRGFILPMWSEVLVEVNQGQVKCMFPDQVFQSEQHPERQHRGFLPGWQNLKLKAPWVMREKTGVSFLGVNPVWNYPHGNHPYMLPHGVLNFKYQPSIHLNTMVELRKERYHFTIQPGEPVWHLVPLTEQSVDVKIHLVTGEEMDRIKYKNITFFGMYRQVKNLLK